jgi:hypothetical protein
MNRRVMASFSLLCALLSFAGGLDVLLDGMRLPFGLLTSRVHGAQGDDVQTVPILDSADSFFRALKARDYVTAWSKLSALSRKTIVQEVVKWTKNDRQPVLSPELIQKDFSEGGPSAQSYWNAFLVDFDPDSVLEQSTWEMGMVKGQSAEISLLYKKAQGPAKLKMFNENGQWKVGLAETFKITK